jgi:activator of 2-hydroxyglutaryl-CoA dehydratase
MINNSLLFLKELDKKEDAMYKAGIDVGSTTVKMVVFDDNYDMKFSRYERHFSDVKTATIKVLKDMMIELGDIQFAFSITGSGGMGLSDVIGATFIQEVIASTLTIEKFIPQTDVMIELGGEDAKMTFFDGAMELTNEWFLCWWNGCFY